MVQIGFYFWALYSLFLIFHLIQRTKNYKVLKLYVTFITIWVIYITNIAGTDILKSLALPPKVPVMIVMPLIVFQLVTISSKSFKTVLQKTSLHLPIYMQSFRIVVELLIYGAFLEGAFPKRATFEGLNFDILVGVSAIPIAYFVQTQKINKQGILIWNILTLCVLSLTVYSFIYTYYFTDFVARQGRIALVEMPYVLLPSILLPVAIFLHIFSIKQVISKL